MKITDAMVERGVIRPRDGHTCEICRSQPLFVRGAQNVASNDSEVAS